MTNVCQLGDNGRRPLLNRQVYAFRGAMSPEQLLKEISAAFDEALGEARADGTALPHSEEYLTWSGSRAGLPGGLLPPARTKKHPGSQAAGGSKADWHLSIPVPGRMVGDVVPFSDDIWVHGDVGAVKIKLDSGGEMIALIEDPKGKTPEDFVKEKKDEAVRALRMNVEEPEDVRTLGVEKNSRGRRHKPFSNAVAELVEDAFEDWPLRDGIRSFLWLVEKMDSDGLAPIAWVEAYLARKKFGENDRASHELRSMARSIEG